jgi:hypothetical protein
MRRLQVITSGFAVLMFVTACAGTAEQAPHHDPAPSRSQRHAEMQGAVTGKRQSASSVPSPGRRPGNWGVPASRFCSSPARTTEARDPLPCVPMLLVPVIVRDPRPGQPRIIYVRKPCFCGAGS